LSAVSTLSLPDALPISRIPEVRHRPAREARPPDPGSVLGHDLAALPRLSVLAADGDPDRTVADDLAAAGRRLPRRRIGADHALRSEEHTSELQSLAYLV